MKNSLFITCLSFLLLFTCTSGDDNSSNDSSNDANTVLLKKWTKSNGDSGVFTYNGNKLNRITSNDGNYLQLNYTGNFVTSYYWVYSGVPSTYIEYFEYSNEKIVRWQAYDDDELVLDYSIEYINNDIAKTIDLDDPIGDYTLTYFDSNGEIIRGERYINNQLVYEGSINFDNKNHPYKNIIGLNMYMRDIYIINITNVNLHNILITGATNNTSLEYQYNSQDFPISIEAYNSNNNRSDSWELEYY